MPLMKYSSLDVNVQPHDSHAAHRPPPTAHITHAPSPICHGVQRSRCVVCSSRPSHYIRVVPGRAPRSSTLIPCLHDAPRTTHHALPPSHASTAPNQQLLLAATNLLQRRQELRVLYDIPSLHLDAPAAAEQDMTRSLGSGGRKNRFDAVGRAEQASERARQRAPRFLLECLASYLGSVVFVSA